MKNAMSSDSEPPRAMFDQSSWAPSVVAAHIAVATNAGVTLTGHVVSFANKHAVKAAAKFRRPSIL
jgi:hypothetical protein